MRLLFRFLSLLLFSLASLANAGDLIISRAVLADPTGSLTIDKVVQQEFQPSGAILSKGYTDVVHWLRLEVNAPNSDEPIELRIRPTFLDEVQLYEPDTNSPHGWKMHITGDRYPFFERERAAITLGFIIHPAAPVTTYYLRLRTTSASILNIEALTDREAKFKDLRLDLVQVIYLAIMFWLLIWALHNFLDSRQPVIAWFLLYQVSYIGYDLSMLGYFAPLMPSDAPHIGDYLTSLLIFSTVWLSSIFHRTLFNLFSPPAKWLHTLDGLILSYPFLFVLLMWRNPREALQGTSLIILLIAVLYLVLALTARQDAPPGRRALRIVYVLHFLSLLASIFPILGWIEAVEWNLHTTLIHGLISGSLMFWILHLRLREVVKAGQKAHMDLALTRQQLTLEHGQKEEQTRFINMLTHELKTPLSILRMVLGAPSLTNTLLAQAHRAIQDMNNVIQQCMHVDKLEDPSHIPQWSEVELLTEIQQLRQHHTAPDRIVIETDTTAVLNTDVQMLRIILSNLLDNALKYSPPDSAVKITISQYNQLNTNWFTIVVANLPGIAGWPDSQKIFKKYYRSVTAHHQIGTGLGLYLIEHLACRLGGKVSYTPDDTHICFTLWLPA